VKLLYNEDYKTLLERNVGRLSQRSGLVARLDREKEPYDRECHSLAD
jgi:hypothetical protein